MALDPAVLALLIPILALSIPVAGIVFAGLVKLQRVRAETRRHPGLLAELDELRHEVAQVRAELTEAQERLDFAERLLASNAERGRMPGTEG